MKWGQDEVTKFLVCYKTLRCLWDPDHREYKDKLSRERALETLRSCVVGPHSKLSVNDVKNKIKGLRTTYSEELNKIIYTNGEYVPKVFWFKLADNFLRGIIEGKKKRYDYTPSDSCSELYQDEQLHTELNEEVCTSYEESTANPLPAEVHTCTHPEDPSAPLTTQDRESTDECSLFGQSVALQLRGLPHLDALDLMQKIQLLINNKKQYLRTERIIMSSSQRPAANGDHQPVPSSEEVEVEAASEDAAGGQDTDDDETFVFQIKAEVKENDHDPLAAKRMRL